MIYLITLTRKQDRRQIQRQAAREGWSAPDLYTVLQSQFHNESASGGRPVKVPKSAEAKLRLIVHESDRWLRRCEAVFQEKEQGACWRN